MFGRIKKNTKKQLEKEAKAAAEAVEAAKSEAQREYEKIREESKDAALAFANEAQTKLAAMGWRWLPIIQHINQNMPHVVAASMVLTEIPWESWEKRSNEKKAKEAGTEAALESTQASPDDAGEAQAQQSTSDTPEVV